MDVLFAIHYVLATVCGVIWMFFESRGLRIVGISTLTGVLLGVSRIGGEITLSMSSLIILAMAWGVLDYLEEIGHDVERLKLITLLLVFLPVFGFTPLVGFVVMAFTINVWIYAYYKTSNLAFVPIALGFLIGYLSNFTIGELGYVIEWGLVLIGIALLRR